MTASESDQILDRTVIETLRELGGDEEPELFEELVTMFLDDTPGRLEALLQALEEGDAHALERTAHGLKSSCGNLGARRLAALCFEIESAGRAGDVDAARPLVNRSTDEFVAVAAALKSELG